MKRLLAALIALSVFTVSLASAADAAAGGNSNKTGPSKAKSGPLKKK
jgi:hypothetical protein